MSAGPFSSKAWQMYCEITSDSGSARPSAVTRRGILPCGFMARYSSDLMLPPGASEGLVMAN